MGRLTTEALDDVLLSKTKWLIAHALEKANCSTSSGLKSGSKRTYAQFVDDLDCHDSFSKRIFELLVKETIQRRARPLKVESESTTRHGSEYSASRSPPLPAWRQYRVPPSRQDGSTSRARRFEARVPYISDLAGTPDVTSPRDPSPSSLARAYRELDASEIEEEMRRRSTVRDYDGTFRSLRGTATDVAPLHYVRSSQTPPPFAPLASSPRPHRALQSPQPSTSSSSLDLPPVDRLRPLPDPVEHGLFSLSGPGAISADSFRTGPAFNRSSHRPSARDDFEAFSRQRRARRRLADHEQDDGEDIYERLGSSSSVAALSSLETAHAHWDSAAASRRLDSEELMTASEFLGYDIGDGDRYLERAEAELHAEMRRFEESDARASL